ERLARRAFKRARWVRAAGPRGVGDGRVAAGRQPWPALRLGLWRLQPHPPALVDREAARLTLRARAWDVDQSPLPSGAGESPPDPPRGGGPLPPADPAAQRRRLCQCRRRRGGRLLRARRRAWHAPPRRPSASARASHHDRREPTTMTTSTENEKTVTERGMGFG